MRRGIGGGRGFKIHHSATIIPPTAMMLIVDKSTEQNLLKTVLNEKIYT